MPFVAAPGQFKGNADLCSRSDDTRLGLIDKRRYDPQRSSASDVDRVRNGIVELNTGIRVRISRRVIRMRAVIDHFTAVAYRNCGGRRKEQAVPERDIRAHGSAVRPGELVRVLLVRDLLLRAYKERAVAVFEDLAQIERDPFHAVICRDFFRGFHFLFVLLSVVDGKSKDLLRSVFLYGKSQTDRTVKAAAE